DLASTLRINGAADGTLTISSQITGTGGLTIDRSSGSFMAVTALTSTTANSFAGGVTLQNGILSLSSGGNLGGGPLTVSTTGTGLAATGDLRASAAVTVANPVTITAGAVLNVRT